MQSTTYQLPPFIVGTFLIVLGYIIIKNNPKGILNILLSFVCVGGTLWLYSIFFIYIFAKYSNVAIFLTKTCYAGVTLIAVPYLHFTSKFLNIKNKAFLIFAYVTGFLFVLIGITTDGIIDGFYKYPWGSYPKAGKVHPFYLIFVIGIFIYCLMKLYKASYGKESLKFNKTEINRIKYVFWAYLIGNIGSVDFAQSYGFQIYPFGCFSIAIFITGITIAIIKHQLLDIEIVIKKTIIFAGLLTSVLFILVFPTLLIQEYIFRSAGLGGRLIGLTISGTIIIFTMRRIEDFLINVTDRYLFQKKYDYKELLKTFTSEVLTVLNLDDLLNLTVDKLSDTMKLKSCAILMFNGEKEQFETIVFRNIKDPSITLAKPDGIAAFLEHTHGYLLRKELTEKKIFIPEDVHAVMDKLSSEFMIPMILQEKVMGILSLGKKKSDEDYTQDDIDILLSLARTLAIAISNAQLFDELGKTQAEAAQKEKMAVIGTLSAGINHEICNPLGIARGQCEAFLLNTKDGLYKDVAPEELLKKAQVIMIKVIRETDRATSITKKLSSFAKPAKGEAELVDIEKEIGDVIGLVGYELKLEKIEFERNIEPNIPNIFVDRKQFQEVLFNLIRNAGQAIGDKGKITLSARASNDMVHIDIQDTGAGISEKNVKMLFNPFFTTKDPGKGTGLGLFIVRQVIGKNGGRIHLKSTKIGEGTTFTVEFPTAAVASARLEQEAMKV